MLNRIKYKIKTVKKGLNTTNVKKYRTQKTTQFIDWKKNTKQQGY